MEFQNGKKKRLVALLSGGLDSPVSLYLMAKKGFDCIILSFLTGQDPELKNRDKIIKIVEKIKELTGSNFKLYIADHDSTLSQFSDAPLRKLICLMCKRYMLRAARLLVIKEQADFIINGDILGEQASQTLDNLVQIQKVVNDIPVVRPLIGFEKADVIKISQNLGIFPLSSLPAPSCGRNPKYPETHAKERDIIFTETDIDYDVIARKIISKAEILEF